jgi:hypothetical protein
VAVLKDPLSWSERDRDDDRSRWLDRESADREMLQEIGRYSGPAMTVLSPITMPRSGLLDS